MEAMKKNTSFSYLCYRAIRGLVRVFYPKPTLEGLENWPEEPCILVGNHCQMNGPIVVELYIPGKRNIWCAGQMMHLKDVPAYAYQDFWSGKPKSVRWFYKGLSYLIAPLSVCIFNQAHTIGVYRDARIASTFKKTITALEDGANVVVFPEHLVPHNNIVYDFQDKFIDVARLYYKRTGKKLAFVPMYIAPKLRKTVFGAPVLYDPEAPKDLERVRVAGELMDRITELALNLPRHTVVPYANISKKDYPMNIPCEVELTHEETCC